MLTNENEVICLCPEIRSLKISCFIQHNVLPHKNMERNQSAFGFLSLGVFFQKKST